jgi:hypothetical protein
MLGQADITVFSAYVRWGTTGRMLYKLYSRRTLTSKESSCKCLLTSYVHLSPPTSQILTIAKYNTSLYVVLENSSSDTISSI